MKKRIFVELQRKDIGSRRCLFTQETFQGVDIVLGGFRLRRYSSVGQPQIVTVESRI